MRHIFVIKVTRRCILLSRRLFFPNSHFIWNVEKSIVIYSITCNLIHHCSFTSKSSFVVNRFLVHAVFWLHVTWQADIIRHLNIRSSQLQIIFAHSSSNSKKECPKINDIPNDYWFKKELSRDLRRMNKFHNQRK